MKDKLVQFDRLNEMLDDDPAYFIEICEAAITSFTYYRDDYNKSMLSHDLTSLRKAGHRIRPVAQMIGVDEIMSEYENAKELLNNDAANEHINDSIATTESLCNQIIDEFHQKMEES
jgi:TolB-like protein